MGYLDTAGLAHLWEKVTRYVDRKLTGGGRGAMTSVTLAASGWTGNQQTVSVPGVTKDETKQWISPTPFQESQNAYYDAGVMVIKQEEGALTFRADNTPTEDLNVFILIQEVEYGSV